MSTAFEWFPRWRTPGFSLPFVLSAHPEKGRTNMAYIHIAVSKGFAADDVRRVEEKVGLRAAIDGLIVEAWGLDGDRLRHVTVWESKAHKDRYEAEQLLPAVQALRSEERR